MFYFFYFNPTNGHQSANPTNGHHTVDPANGHHTVGFRSGHYAVGDMLYACFFAIASTVSSVGFTILSSKSLFLSSLISSS